MTAPTPAGMAEQAVKVCPQCEGEGGYPDGVDEAAIHTDCTRCAGEGYIVDLAALAAQPSAGAEPVAWIAVWNDGTPYGDPHRWPPLEGACTYHGLMSRTIQPLYTHPAPVLTAGDEGGAVKMLRDLKSRLMHHRRFGNDGLNEHRRMCATVEGDIEEWLIDHGYQKSDDREPLATPVQPDSGGGVEALREALEKARDHYDMLTRLANGDAVYEVNPDTGKRTRRKLSEVIASECDAGSKHCRAALAPVAAEGGESTGAQAVIRNGKIVISIDVDALPVIVSGSCMTSGAVDGLWKVTDAEAFAEDVCHALNDEREDGTTRVHLMFDSAFNHAIEQGAEGIEDVDEDEFEAESSRLQSALRTEPTGGGEGA